MHDRAYLRAAKARLVAAIDQRVGWEEAAATAPLLISRATAYRIWLRACCAGPSPFEDQRHGHPAKVRGPVPAWIVAQCQAQPQMPSHVLQIAIQQRFAITLSVRHLNRVRAAVGVRFERSTTAQKK